MTKTNVGERIMKIETDINYIKEAVNEMKASLKAHTDWEAEKYDSLEKKFAAKWVEKAVYGVIGVILTLIITYSFKVLVG